MKPFDSRFTNWETNFMFKWAREQKWEATGPEKLANEIEKTVLNTEPLLGSSETRLGGPSIFDDLLSGALNQVDYQQVAYAIVQNWEPR